MSSPMMKHCPQKGAVRGRGIMFRRCVWCTPSHVIGKKRCAAHLDGTFTDTLCEKALRRLEAEVKAKTNAARENGGAI